jgi:predicted ribosome quality control (RQC) complex YloA/Tae2 family protein
MPYRRLPNTDISRLAALKTAYEKYKSVPFNDIAFEKDKAFKLELLIREFEKIVVENRENLKIKLTVNKTYKESFKNASMFVSHFIQVLNLAVIRGDIPAEAKKLYKLPKANIVPKHHIEQDLVKLGHNVIEGEKKRTYMGASPIMNPSIAVVKVKFDQFYDLYMKATTTEKSAKRIQDTIILQRKKVDKFIKRLWNDIEEYLKKHNTEDWRDQARQYGVVYVYRPYEVENMSQQERDELIGTNLH